MSRPLIIYHGPGCMDGFTAAWVAWLRLGDGADYEPAAYGEAPPDVAGREVYVLDFSYPREQLVAMKAVVRSLLVLDHHKSAQKDLAGLDFCTFDMNRSGARMAFDYFREWARQDDNTAHIYADAEKLVEYVQDRDLWRWGLPESKEINAAIASERQDFSAWSRLAFRLQHNPHGAVIEGAAILRYERQQVLRIVKTARSVVLAGHEVLCANAPVCQSEVGEALAEGRPFGVGWYLDDAGKVRVSLRSRGPEGVDVSEIARLFGGGGHRNAAGFEVDPWEWLGFSATEQYRPVGLV